MDPASRAAKAEVVRDELQRMALDELRQAKRLTQTYLAEMLDAPQSSISRIEQRADMYVSTLRDYVHAMGGCLQIQAVFPDGGGAGAMNRFGEYEERSYVVRAGSRRVHRGSTGCMARRSGRMRGVGGCCPPRG